jgi:methyltransferase FkbM-like protein
LNPSLTSAVAVQCALSDCRGLVPFFTGGHTGAGHLAAVGDTTGQQLQVRTITLDDFVIVDGHQPPNFVKIDVEGAESRVLMGAERVLRMARPTLLVDLHTPEQDVAVGSILADVGYDAYRTHNGAHVRHLRRGWPDPDGLWGKFIAFPTG